MKRISLGIPLFALFVTPGLALAQSFEGARLIGHGGAQRALTNANDAIYINPAGLALGALYSVELGYLDDLRSSERRFNASIADSQAGPLAGGLAYTYTRLRPEGESDEAVLVGHRVDVSLATLVAEGAAIGVTARYLNLNVKEGDVPVDGAKLSTFTLDAGVQWRIGGGFSLGAAGYNLTNNERSELPVGWGAGIGYGVEAFSIEGDVRYNAQIGKAAYTGTAGYVISQLVPIRAAVTYDLANERVTVSGGIGFITQRFVADLGYQQIVNAADGEDDARIAGLSLRGMFF
ncbi:hypothetical protein L6R52_29505 [Myxococcota bacterium]|nr:hypothetical protein [Myxococcota bacterium]